jgi:hypothetical protein
MRPIHIAAKNGFKKIVEYIVSHSKNKQECLKFPGTESKSSPFQMTAIKGYFELGHILIEHGSDVAF